MINSKFTIKALLLLIFWCVFTVIFMSKSFAQEELLPFKKLGLNDPINLKTIQSSKELTFSKPANWKIKSIRLNLTLQHSDQLLPDRSRLNVMLNNKLIKTIPLDKTNINESQIEVNLPAADLKEQNIIVLTAHQHYTNKCEDPFDSSLWTTVLPESSLKISYSETPPELNLSKYPYPFYDDLGYEPVNINFVMPDLKKTSDKTLKAMALITGNLARYTKWKSIKINTLKSDNLNAKENLIIVGTIEENPALLTLIKDQPYSIQKGRFVDQSKKPIEAGTGVIMLIPNAANSNKTLLIVSGSDSEGVLKAARILTLKPLNKLMEGTSVLIKEDNAIKNAQIRDWKEWINKDSIKLENLFYSDQTVKGSSSSPISYNIKIMPDIKISPGDKATIKTLYKYSSNLDTNMSNLQVIFNGNKIKSVKLDNPQGETAKTLIAEIPSTMIMPYNQLVYEFNLYPIKEGYCKFVTDQHLWGSILSKTELTLPTYIKAGLPDLGLLNDGGYPFTLYPDLQNVAVILDNHPDDIDVELMLNVISRLCRYLTNDTPINLNVVKAKDVNKKLEAANHLILIGNIDKNPILKMYSKYLNLRVNNNEYQLYKGNKKLVLLENLNKVGIIEEIISPFNKKLTVLGLFGKSDQELSFINNLFADDKMFNKLSSGDIALVTGNNLAIINSSEGDNKYSPENFGIWYLKVLLAMLVVVILIIVFVKFHKKL